MENHLHIETCEVCGRHIKVKGFILTEDCTPFICSEDCAEMRSEPSSLRISSEHTNIGDSPLFKVEDEIPGPILKFYEP